MLDLCLFDLDNTLLRTEDLQDIRPQGIRKHADAAYKAQLLSQFGDPADRYIYTPSNLAALRSRWPVMKLGIFTRSPEAYCQALIDSAYPEFPWDIIVAYEAIPNGLYKPNGWGIRASMQHFGIVDPKRVVMVGDESIDVKAAYNAGVWAVLDKSAWPARWDSRKHWAGLELIPDAIIERPDELLSALDDIEAYSPHLEWELNDSLNRIRQPRFSSINHFYPREVGEPAGAKEEIYSAGRHFSDYRSLDNRRNWHALTKSIHENKDSVAFPAQWCNAVHEFVRTNFPFLSLANQSVTIAAIPARPGRAPRMQHFIAQLRANFQGRKALGRTHDSVQFSMDLLSYAGGVRSQSGDHLNRLERFENVRDHLAIADPEHVQGKDFIVIDDVCTSGATLMYAKKRLIEAGARTVKLLALSKNVSDVL